MKDYSVELQELKEKGSIEIFRGTRVIWPLQGDRIGTLDMTEVIGKFLGVPVYATNNSTIAYIDHGHFYIAPYTREAIEILRNTGFTKEDFYVPCSNGDIPKKQAKKWEQLRTAARDTYATNFALECADWCKKHRIREISDRALDRCLEVPEEGMKIRVNGIESTYYPILQSGILNESSCEKLGRYSSGKNIVVFVYRNGKTYIAKGLWIITELNLAGFQSTKSFYVPSLKDDGILEPHLKKQFALMPAFR